MVFGYLLAVFMDQRIRQEDLLRSIFLYPFAMSLIVTGLVWQWILDPNLGIENTMHSLGWTCFHFSPLVDPSIAIYGLVVAGIWQGSGVTMAILLAGLRGVDAEIWKAAKVDGIPTWRTYLFIALPMMGGAVATAFVLQCVGVVRVYDLIIAMTGGGPGISTNMPAVYVIDMITSSQNVGQGMAAATMMLLPIVIVLAHRRPACLAKEIGEGRQRDDRASMPSMTDAEAVARMGRRADRGRSRSASRRRGLASMPSWSISALFFLIPLYVMIVTSLKEMPEIRLGYLFGAAAEVHVPAVDRRLAACLYRTRLQRPQSRLPELGQDHRAERDHLDRDRLDQWLRAVVLALQGRQLLLRPPRLRRLRALPGGDLPADHRRARGRPVLDARRASSSCTPSSACRS